MIVPNLETNPNPITITTTNTDGEQVTLANVNLNSAKVLQSATYTDPIVTNGTQSISLPYPAYTINFTTDIDQVLPVIDYVALTNDNGLVDTNNAYELNSENLLYNDSNNVKYPSIPAGGSLFNIKSVSGNNPYYILSYYRNSNSGTTTQFGVLSNSYYVVFSNSSYTACSLFGFPPDEDRRVVYLNLIETSYTDNNPSRFYLYKRLCLCSIDV